MNWTRTRPTEPGRYCHRADGATNGRTTYLRLVFDQRARKLVVAGSALTLADFAGGWWMGPLSDDDNRG